jgi:hypothetical protein
MARSGPRATVTRRQRPTGSVRASGDATAAAQVAGFIARFEPRIARLARQARAHLRRRWPSAHELVYDNYNALAIGYASTERTSDVIVSVAVYASGVNLYFMYGASLDDPGGLLEGAGTRGRFVRLSSAALLSDRRVGALLDRAAAGGRTPLSPAGRGRTIVKSISRTQRPRRPGR